MSPRPPDGRWLAGALVLAYAVLLWLTAQARGIESALNVAGVPSVGAPFSDLYVFPAAAGEFDRGGNPYLSNPSDPWRRTYNYPRVWLLFMRYPFAAVPWLGFGLGGAWLLAVGAYWGRLTLAQGLAAGALVCSPPVALALERGNSDLLIFLLIAAGLGCLSRGWRVPAWLLFLGGALLKLYPLVAFSAFLRAGARRGWAWLAGGLLAFGLWAALHFGELHAIAHNTPAGGPAVSYGATVVFYIAEKLHGDKTGEWGAYVGQAWVGSVAAAALAAGLAWLGFRRRSPSAGASFDRALAGFHVGAGIYLLTFILGSNFVYRQIFLLFCLPWLLRKDPGFRFARLRVAAAVTLFLCLWANPLWWIALLAVREVAGWSLVAMLACLAGATVFAECDEKVGRGGPIRPPFASG
jgi:hypothetical protein